MLIIVFALAVGVFFYGRLLASTQASKEAELAKAEAAIDSATVDNFVRLRNRLNASKALLGKHVALSNVFSALETIQPTSMRFSSLHIMLDDVGGTVKLEGSGLAKNFNSLAFASESFSSDSRIKDVIFSKIGLTKDTTVGFNVAASVDPKLIVYSPNANAPDLSGISSIPSAPSLTQPVAATSTAAATSGVPAKTASTAKSTAKSPSKPSAP